MIMDSRRLANTAHNSLFDRIPKKEVDSAICGVLFIECSKFMPDTLCNGDHI